MGRVFGLKLVWFVVLFFVVFGLSLHWQVGAQSGSLLLQVEQHWDTYGVGGTCIPGQHNLFMADVDGDGVPEIITGGFTYNVYPNGTRTPIQAPFDIWSWNGQNLTLEHSEKWGGSIGCVFAADVDGDGKTEIMTTSSASNSSGSASTLRFWNWNGQTLVLRGGYGGVYAGSVFVADVDEDGKQEVITLGKPFNSTSQLCVWKWNGENLTLEANTNCCDSKGASANSVYAYDLNKDGMAEIIAAGYDNNLNNSTGQLRIWQMNNGNLSLESSTEWRMVDGYALNSAGNIQGNTVVNNVKVADVDGDGVPEIVTGGFTYDGAKVDGQLRIWNWSKKTLNLEKSQEWVTSDITELKTISINDVDSDGRTEIVTSGVTTGYGSFAANATNKEVAQLRVWSWNGNTILLKQSQDWKIGDGVCAWNVATGDLDNKGVNDVVTVGCMYIGTLCDPDLRIWSISGASASATSFPSLPVVIAGLSTVAMVTVGAYLFTRKRRR